MKKQFLMTSLMMISLILISNQKGECYQISKYVFSGGGGIISNGNYNSNVVIGEGINPLKVSTTQYSNIISSGYVLLRAPSNKPQLVDNSTYTMPNLQINDFFNQGMSISDLIDQNQDVIRDVDDPNKLGFALTGVINNNGQWQYTINNGNTWVDLDLLSENTAILLAANGADTRLRFVPEPYYAEGDTGNITFYAWDQSKGNNGQYNVNINHDDWEPSISRYSGTIQGGQILGDSLDGATIPTLSEWGMLIFTGLLMLTAMIKMRNEQNIQRIYKS